MCVIQRHLVHLVVHERGPQWEGWPFTVLMVMKQDNAGMHFGKGAPRTNRVMLCILWKKVRAKHI